MQLKYFKETDTLYIDLSHKESTDSIEVGNGIVIDLDEENNIVGIDIDSASKKLDFSSFKVDIPFAEIST